MTPEGKIKEHVKRVLRKHEVFWFCPVQNGMGSPSLDFLCCAKGKFIGIETKAPGKKPTPRQMNTMDDMFKSGADVFVVDGPEALEILDKYFNGDPSYMTTEYLKRWMQYGS